ncbi:hypothetical protein BDV19DRAFT_378339 [Aspergillus venezuelensis]
MATNTPSTLVEWRAIDRFHAVLGAALNIARKEQQTDSKAKLFVAVFGLDRKAGHPLTADLCAIADALLAESDGGNRDGHDLLLELANENNLEHITGHIQSKLTDGADETRKAMTQKNGSKFGLGVLSPLVGGTLGDLLGLAIGVDVGFGTGAAVDKYEDKAIDLSEGLKLARKMCKEWFQDFMHLVPRPAAEIVHLLQELQQRSATADDDLSSTIEEFMYGDTPMCDALSRSLAAFRRSTNVNDRILVLLSGGWSTDGEPDRIVSDLRSQNVKIAGVYFTNDEKDPQRRLYDRPESSRRRGQCTLFNMSSKIPSTNHPIPVLGSIGWQIPSSGEAALYSSVCTSTAIDEFCSLLVSAHLGYADALLEMIGRVRLDEIISKKHNSTCNNPSDQGEQPSCYAHAIAAVIHMTLVILREFPPAENGGPTEALMKEVVGWYRLCYRVVDETGARQAILHRRPVVATFCLSNPQWEKFYRYFDDPLTRGSIFINAAMESCHRGLPGNGHAVILYACDPHSLSFLNSWGNEWGRNGSFRVQSPAVLETDYEGHGIVAPMSFYEVYWLESELTQSERAAYDEQVDEKIRGYTASYPTLLELEATCPLCKQISIISDFTGNAREATCPVCSVSFVPQPGNLIQALYARAGLSD